MTSASLDGTAAGTPRGLFREVLAVLLLTIGSLVPIIPWLVGAALLWTSHRWRTGEKLLATLVWPLGYAPVLFALSLPATTQSCLSATTPAGATVEKCTSTGMPQALGSVITLVLVVAPLVVDGVLLVRAGRRARAERASAA